MLPWQTGPQLAALWRVPLGTVRYWASVDHWPRTHTRPTRYDPEAAQASYERRRHGNGSGRETAEAMAVARARREVEQADKVRGLARLRSVAG